MHISLHWQVAGAPHQALSDETVVHRYDQQWYYVENEERGHGVNLRVQFNSMGIRSTGNKTLISGGDVEGVEVREHSLRYCQDQGQDPDKQCLQDNAGSGG